MADDKQVGIDFTAMIPQLTQEVSAELRRRAVESLQYEASAAVSAAVKEFIATNIVPAIQAELTASSAELRATFLAAVKQSVTLSAAQLVEHTQKRLGAYDGEKVVRETLRAIFGSPY